MRKIYQALVLSSLSFIILQQNVKAQQNYQHCETEAPSQQWEEKFQQLITEFNQKRQNNRSAPLVYKIPVIFHVVHGGEPIGTYPNLLQGQINSQITVLNADFSGTGLNASSYPPNAFVNWAINQSLPSANIDANGRVKIADVGVQFCLADKDTLGNLLVEPGIERIDYNARGWANPTSFTNTNTFKNYLDGTIKPQSIWNVRKYLNIWVTNKSTAFNAVGVSTMPPFSGLGDLPNITTDSTDGIWCCAAIIGSKTLFPSGTYQSAITEGRICTHETGHYLGLRHIWGDASCGNDYCNDTPTATTSSSVFMTYPANAGSCTGNSPDGIMYMNFMDYGPEPDKYMFTVDQMTRIQTAMTNSPFRNQLGTHGLCLTTGLNDYQSISENPVMYPNPTEGDVAVISGQDKIKQIKIYNFTGELVFQSERASFSVSHLPSGVYTVCVLNNNSVFTTKLIKH